MSFFDSISKIFGDKFTRDQKALQPIVDKILALTPEVEKLNNDQLRSRIDEVRAEIAGATAEHYQAIDNIRDKIEDLPIDERQSQWDAIDRHEKKILEILDEQLEKHLPIVFAVLRETAARFAANETITVQATDLDRELAAQGKDFITIDGDKSIWKNSWMAGGNTIKWDMTHYEVQLKGGIVLFQGKIAEMATGEGKTLVATLPVFLRSMAKKGVHVVTVNDYLAKRDCEWMGPLYMFHGATVDCIDKHQPNTPERRAAYNCDITYGTNNEFGFDYLRDNMAMDPEDMVQRKHYYAIVDEVDSVLIDDARTPLIISGPVPKGDDQFFNEFKGNVENVVQAQKRLVTQILSDAKTKLASENPEDKKEGALLLFRAYKGLPKNGALIKFLSQEGNKTLLLKTEAHYLQDNAREMPEVTDPLYFVIDEKNRSVELTDKGLDALTGRISDSQFFVLPNIAELLSQLDHIEDIEERAAKKDAILQDYAIKAERVHTVTQLLKAYTLFEKDVEYVIDDNKIKIVDEQTGRIMEGRRYSDGLHQAIEAKEGVKVEAATQTFATITLQNYFRMYYKLAGMTGTADTEAGEFWDIYKLDVVRIPTNRPIQRIDRNDLVYRTKREKYAAVIDEIENMVKAGRPVLVGTTSVEISQLISRMLDMRRIPHQVLNAKLHQKEAEIVAQAGRPGTVTIATNMAGRGTDIKITPEVKAAGGLAIIGTERHESRRVDNQLRGRSGRQGDPGSSVFYVSFEDPLMRVYASDTVVKLLDRLGFKEGEVLEHRMISNSIAKAQKRVEENNFGIRKHLLDYDDVMNKQRTFIYHRRNHALKGERIGIDISNTIYDAVDNLVKNYPDGALFDDLKLEMMRLFAVEPEMSRKEFESLSHDDKVDTLHQLAMQRMERSNSQILQTMMPMVQMMVSEGQTGLRALPITDGKRVFRIVFDIEEAVNTEGRSLIKEWQKRLILLTIDELWKEHLRENDDLRQSVRNASYEQKDPLVIYKQESFHMFQRMLATLNERTVQSLMRAKVFVAPQSPRVAPDGQTSTQTQTTSSPSLDRPMPRRRPDSDYKTSKATLPSEEQARAQAQAAAAPRGPQAPAQPFKVNAPRIGRNDPCPCGSGKKYKNCHGAGK
ncbi:MAG: preprotein translocase subunit SecA [Muribaculaceae bacterium]|nr:preprotein translocase subunit SecA [Muribaculaceae bacterium]